MRHLTISEFGYALGVSGNRLVVSHEGVTWETPLSRLRSIRIEKKGVSISSNLIMECSNRGIRLYFVDWRNIATAVVSGQNQHAVVSVRQSQFECIRSDRSFPIASEFITTKIRNQRAVLLYFSKYFAKSNPGRRDVLVSAAEILAEISEKITEGISKPCRESWRVELMGREGLCARLYWDSLAQVELLPLTFLHREGRGAVEITNAALNYGYTILQSYVWSVLDNAGFELYAGLLHANRPGKPSLVLDFMEEYRAWVVDRNIIKLRSHLCSVGGVKSLDKNLKEKIVNAIDDTMGGTIEFHHKKIKLENIMQRQAYQLAGTIMGERKYRGFRFKW